MQAPGIVTYLFYKNRRVVVAVCPAKTLSEPRLSDGENTDSDLVSLLNDFHENSAWTCVTADVVNQEMSIMTIDKRL